MNNGYVVEGKTIELAKYDWDILIILDACRYDYFSKINNIDGVLKKAYTYAVCTPQYLKNNFDSLYKDIIYISAMPHLNSKGIPIKYNNYVAKGKFFKIVDVWDWGFNPNLGTVHPKEVNKSAIPFINLYKNKRFVVHYAQPHEPYLYYSGGPKENKGLNRHMKKIVKIHRFTQKYISNETLWRISNLFEKLPEKGKGKLWIKYGREGIIKGYEENLKEVLKYTKNLVDLYPKKKFLITADHGELLGEKKRYGHFYEWEHPKLHYVPWLELNND